MIPEIREEVVELLGKLGIQRTPNASDEEHICFETKVLYVQEALSVAWRRGKLHGISIKRRS